MYAIEVTDTRTGITEMSTCRFETIRQAETYLDKCPSCGMSNSIAWGSLMATPQKEAVAMLANSWNGR